MQAKSIENLFNHIIAENYLEKDLEKDINLHVRRYLEPQSDTMRRKSSYHIIVKINYQECSTKNAANYKSERLSYERKCIRILLQHKT